MDRQTEYLINQLRNEVEALKSQVEQLSDELNSAVKKNEVISAINLSQGGIRIQGDKIFINEDTLITDNILKKEGN